MPGERCKSKQEIHCHGCNRYVQFTLDLGLDGNHVLDCPNCGHEHCRVVKDGVITGERWAQRNGYTHQITSATTSAVSIGMIASNAAGGIAQWATTASTTDASPYWGWGTDKA